jgi:hypothetical protein
VIKNEEACANNRKLLRINGEKHDEMLLPLTPLSVLIPELIFLSCVFMTEKHENSYRQKNITFESALDHSKLLRCLPNSSLGVNSPGNIIDFPLTL